MPHIIVPKHSRNRRPRATLQIEAREGGRLELVYTFDPPVPNARQLHDNPAAEALVLILRAAQLKGVIGPIKGLASGGQQGNGEVDQAAIPTDEELGG